jgi:16S rRNA (guanine966-N2)-methyltransferase
LTPEIAFFSTDVFCYNCKMRITGGEFCGRRLSVPDGNGVRPTQDRVREALFSMLMNKISTALFVDLYAGCGSVGLDALSRGAADVFWVERNRRHLRWLQENKERIGLLCGRVICSDAEHWCTTGGDGLRADIVFADPPYEESVATGFVQLGCLLRKHNVIAEDGVFVAESSVNASTEKLDGWELIKERVYGHTRLTLYTPVCTGNETAL